MQFNADMPIYLQITDYIKRMIVSGRWKRGDRVPPVRELALEMGVNPNTVQRAVALLEDEGLLHTERTSGRYVTTDEATVEKVKQNMTATEIEKFMVTMRDMGHRDEEIAGMFVPYIRTRQPDEGTQADEGTQTDEGSETDE